MTMIVFALATLYVVCCTLAWSARRMAHAGLRTCAILTSGVSFVGLTVFAWVAFFAAYNALSL
jgi:hypothetical protein